VVITSWPRSTAVFYFSHTELGDQRFDFFKKIILQNAGLCDPVTLDFEKSTITYYVEAFSISIGALIGPSPVITYCRGNLWAICRMLIFLPLFISFL